MAKRKVNKVQKLYSKLQKASCNLLKLPIGVYKKLSKKQQRRMKIGVLALLLVVGFNLLSSLYNAGPPRLPQFFNTLTGSTTLDSDKFDIVDSSLLAGDDSCSKKTSQFVLLVSDELQTYSDLLYKNLIESTDRNKFIYISIVNDTDDDTDQFRRKITSPDHKYFIGSRIFEPVLDKLEDVKDLNGVVKTGQTVFFVFRDAVTYCDNSAELANKTKIDRSGYHLVFAEGKAKDLFPLDASDRNQLIVKKAYVTSLIKSDELLNPNEILDLGLYWFFLDYNLSESDLQSMQATDRDLDGVLNVDDKCDSSRDGFEDTVFGVDVDDVGCSQAQAGDDTDSDGIRDAVDLDDDNDGIEDDRDNCPNTLEAESEDVNAEGCGSSERDTDGDGDRDNVDIDDDDDGIEDDRDNCPRIVNPVQTDTDGDGAGDVCDEDDDNDGTADEDDDFPLNPDETTDSDGDGIGDIADVCDSTPADDIRDIDEVGCAPSEQDPDNDGLANSEDNCPAFSNPDQADLDEDGIGDICDDDIDGDEILNDADVCALISNSDNLVDTDLDGIPDACDVDVYLNISSVPAALACVVSDEELLIKFEFKLRDGQQVYTNAELNSLEFNIPADSFNFLSNEKIVLGSEVAFEEVTIGLDSLLEKTISYNFTNTELLVSDEMFSITVDEITSNLGDYAYKLNLSDTQDITLTKQPLVITMDNNYDKNDGSCEETAVVITSNVEFVHYETPNLTCSNTLNDMLGVVTFTASSNVPVLENTPVPFDFKLFVEETSFQSLFEFIDFEEGDFSLDNFLFYLKKGDIELPLVLNEGGGYFALGSYNLNLDVGELEKIENYELKFKFNNLGGLIAPVNLKFAFEDVDFDDVRSEFIDIKLSELRSIDQNTNLCESNITNEMLEFLDADKCVALISFTTTYNEEMMDLLEEIKNSAERAERRLLIADFQHLIHNEIIDLPELHKNYALYNLVDLSGVAIKDEFPYRFVNFSINPNLPDDLLPIDGDGRSYYSLNKSYDKCLVASSFNDLELDLSFKFADYFAGESTPRSIGEVESVQYLNFSIDLLGQRLRARLYEYIDPQFQFINDNSIKISSPIELDLFLNGEILNIVPDYNPVSHNYEYEINQMDDGEKLFTWSAKDRESDNVFLSTSKSFNVATTTVIKTPVFACSSNSGYKLAAFNLKTTEEEITFRLDGFIDPLDFVFTLVAGDAEYIGDLNSNNLTFSDVRLHDGPAFIKLSYNGELDHDIIKSFVNNANRINIKYQNIDPEEDQQNLNLVSNSNNTSFPGLNDGNCFKINNARFYKGSRENVEITSSFARLSFSELDQELVLDCREESDGTIKELNNSLRYQCVDNSILLGGYKGVMTNNQFVIVKDSNDSIFSIDKYMFFDSCSSEARGFKLGEHYNFYCANLDECIDALKNDDVRPAERIHTLFEDVDKFPGSNSQQARRSELKLDINYSQYYDVPDNWFEQTKPESFEGDREKLIALLEDQELGGLSFDLDQINDRSDTLLTNGCDTVTFRFVEDDSALQVTCEENDSECESNLVTRANTLYFNYGNKYYFEKTESRQSCSGEYVNNATYNVTYHHSSRKFIFPGSLPNPNDLPLPPSVTNTNDLFTPGLDLPYYANGFNFYGMRTFEFYDLEGNLIDSMDSQVLTSQFSSNFAYTFFLFNSNEACLTFNFTPLGFDDATPNLLALGLNAFIFEPSGLSKIVISDATCSKIELLIDYKNRDVLECEDLASAFEL